ncbi:hypothetical protein Tco_0884482 [Tanacetum coccineum]
MIVLSGGEGFKGFCRGVAEGGERDNDQLARKWVHMCYWVKFWKLAQLVPQGVLWFCNTRPCILHLWSLELAGCFVCRHRLKESIMGSKLVSVPLRHSDDEVFTQIQPQFTTVNNTNAISLILKKVVVAIWAMKIQNYITNSDLPCWNIVLNGNTSKKTTKDSNGNIKICPPVLAEEHLAIQRETKARTTLLTALPDDHMGDFYNLDDAKEIWLAINARFGGNEESKKMQKSFLTQEFEEFKITEAEGLHTGYDKFEKILSQMNTLKVRPGNEDVNLKFLRALPPSWSQVTLVLKTNGGLEYLTFDDLYNKLKSLEFDVKGY